MFSLRLHPFATPLRALSCCLACCLLLLQGCDVYDVMSFNEAAAGLGTPSLELYPENAARMINRIRWMENVIEWEYQKIKPHNLSFLLAKTETQVSKPACSPSCRKCETGDINKGFIDVACWTSNKLGGQLELIVPQIGTSSGYGYVRWQDVCSPADHSSNQTSGGICYTGDTGYNVSISQEDNRYYRMDVNWVVRLSVQEGNERVIRLDGSVGAVYAQRSGAPVTRRTAVYIEEKSLVYQRFSGGLRQGSVDILAANGSFRCTFEVKSEGESLNTTGSCQSLSGGESFSFPQ
ncbi:MAG TPA: hypothetical protein DCE42_25725 [Myxococcales bacterium]|mgnify:CR=1 FL=1|nr:hypothetical protein [Deltaproteobacteria bacterium]MBU47276.1 hypothetical protein [Deltaproteobacteria bacterium]HAA58189.1 hypothetical protein [Myxococcales bacterium]